MRNNKKSNLQKIHDKLAKITQEIGIEGLTFTVGLLCLNLANLAKKDKDKEAADFFESIEKEMVSITKRITPLVKEINKNRE